MFCDPHQMPKPGTGTPEQVHGSYGEDHIRDYGANFILSKTG